MLFDGPKFRDRDPLVEIIFRPHYFRGCEDVAHASNAHRPAGSHRFLSTHNLITKRNIVGGSEDNEKDDENEGDPANRRPVMHRCIARERLNLTSCTVKKCLYM